MADPTGPVFDAADLAHDPTAELDALIKRLRTLGPQAALDQVYRRVRLAPLLDLLWRLDRESRRLKGEQRQGCRQNKKVRTRTKCSGLTLIWSKDEAALAAEVAPRPDDLANNRRMRLAVFLTIRWE